MKRSLLFFILLAAGLKTLAQASLRQDVLDSILRKAKESQSDALLIWQDNSYIQEEYFGKGPVKLEAMSVSKAVLNLAFGVLFTEGKFKNLDTPVYEFFPEWKQGKKKLITIRHLMSHTSGIQYNPDANEVSVARDVVKLALAADLETDPGAVFNYNNKAINLLPPIIEKISGEKFDSFMRKKLFAPLGIVDYEWMKDPVGNPFGMSGLKVYPDDLVKIGQLVMYRGNWKGKPIIDTGWFTLCLPKTVDGKLKGGLMWGPIINQQNKLLGYEAFGHLGQYLFICPARKLIVVRMIHESSFKNEENNFFQLRKFVALLCQ